jgi:hypothetical protein
MNRFIRDAKKHLLGENRKDPKPTQPEGCGYQNRRETSKRLKDAAPFQRRKRPIWEK